jgi:hypothetical protein
MYYDENLRSPISEYNVKRMYGVNPTNEPARAMAAGVYPLQVAPTGYSAARYEKYDTYYRAVPQQLSNSERNDVTKIAKIGTFMRGMLAEAATDVTVVVTVDNGKFLFDGQDDIQVDKYAGNIILDQSDASNANHPIALSLTEDGTHNGGEEYTTNVTYTGTPGTDGQLTFALDIDDVNSVVLYPYCENHAGMGSTDGISYTSTIGFTYVNI